MKKFLPLYLLLYLLLSNSTVSAQKNCSFSIDTVKILRNQNLAAFIAELRTDSFKITNNKKDIPRFIKKQLKCYAHGFRIANPNQSYNATDVGSGRLIDLPRRQLKFLAKSDDILVMQYNEGGIGVSPHLLLVKFDKRKIIDLWEGFCYLVNVKCIDDVIRTLQYTMENPKENYIYF
jgi:hypothetical protein